MKPTTLTYTGTVKDGVIKLPRDRFKKEVGSMFEGCTIEVTVKKKRKVRSDKQSKYYRGVVIPAVVQGFIEAGNDELQLGNQEHHEAIHVWLKGQFLENQIEVVNAWGEAIQLPPSTTRCTTSEMMDYIARIQKFAAEMLNTVIPDPNEQASFFPEKEPI